MDNSLLPSHFLFSVEKVLSMLSLNKVFSLVQLMELCSVHLFELIDAGTLIYLSMHGVDVMICMVYTCRLDMMAESIILSLKMLYVLSPLISWLENT